MVPESVGGGPLQPAWGRRRRPFIGKKPLSSCFWELERSKTSFGGQTVWGQTSYPLLTELRGHQGSIRCGQLGLPWLWARSTCHRRAASPEPPWGRLVGSLSLGCRPTHLASSVFPAPSQLPLGSVPRAGVWSGTTTEASVPKCSKHSSVPWGCSLGEDRALGSTLRAARG